MEIEISEQVPTVTEYCELRKVAGLSPKTEQSAAIGLPKSLFAVSIRSNGSLIAMGRAIGDLGCFVQITDIAVHPEHQGKGLGRVVMERIMAFVERECPKDSFVNLFADVEFLYQKFGFVHSTKSKGMYLDWRLVKPD